MWRAGMWRAEDILRESLLFFHRVGPRDWTPVLLQAPSPAEPSFQLTVTLSARREHCLSMLDTNLRVKVKAFPVPLVDARLSFSFWVFARTTVFYDITTGNAGSLYGYLSLASFVVNLTDPLWSCLPSAFGYVCRVLAWLMIDRWRPHPLWVVMSMGMCAWTV